MVSRSRRRKGKKKKKEGSGRGSLRKFNQDLFGLLTFTRLWGAEWEAWMYEGNKKNRRKSFIISQKDAKSRRAYKKKHKKKEALPGLPKFPPVPEPRGKKKPLPIPDDIDELQIILPMGVEGYEFKATNKPRRVMKSGSVSDVMCGPKYPLPPRPLPHGGIFGDQKDPGCLDANHLLKTRYALVHKKMKKIIKNQWEKAKFVIEYLIGQTEKVMQHYKEHFAKIIAELDPVFDAMDEEEWNEHEVVRELKDKWRQKREELDLAKKELKTLKQNRDEEIQKALEPLQTEVDEAEQELSKLEELLQKAIEELGLWEADPKGRLQNSADEVARQAAHLIDVQNSVMIERDNLRAMLTWETKFATEKTAEEMECIIAADIDKVLSFLHPSWFKLVLENRKLKQEVESIGRENSLLNTDVDFLESNCRKLSADIKHLRSIETFGIRPPNLKNVVSKYFPDDCGLQIYDYPAAKYLHVSE